MVKVHVEKLPSLFLQNIINFKIHNYTERKERKIQISTLFANLKLLFSDRLGCFFMFCTTHSVIYIVVDSI